MGLSGSKCGPIRSKICEEFCANFMLTPRAPLSGSKIAVFMCEALRQLQQGSPVVHLLHSGDPSQMSSLPWQCYRYLRSAQLQISFPSVITSCELYCWIAGTEENIIHVVVETGFVLLYGRTAAPYSLLCTVYSPSYKSCLMYRNKPVLS
jgi:hypothetical protein